MNGILITLIFLLAGLMAGSPAMADKLRRDPFQEPADFIAQADAPGVTPAAPGSRPQIFGILAAGGESLVNLGGEIMAVGEEAGGYQLLEVAEEHAVFRRGDEIITIALYPDKDDESNDD